MQPPETSANLDGRRACYLCHATFEGNRSSSEGSNHIDDDDDAAGRDFGVHPYDRHGT